MDAGSVLVTTIAVVLGWITGEVIVFSRLRIPVFDETERVIPRTPPAEVVMSA